jgi:hypothetical protein
MQQTDALRIVGYLAGLSSGWSDDSIALYAAEIECLDDYDAGLHAAQTVMRSWKDTRRPPVALILDAYQAEKQRRDREVNRFAIGRGVVMPVDEGLAVAWRAYVAECQMQGREPNRPMFAGWARSVGG